MEIKPIQFLRGSALDTASEPANFANDGDWDALARTLSELAADLHAAHRSRYAGAASGSDAITLIAIVCEMAAQMQALDRDYGPDARLPVVDADTAVDGAMRAAAELGLWLKRLDLESGQTVLDHFAIAAGVWAMRHQLAARTVEPLVNALAARANAAASRQEVAAAFGLMQGALAWLEPTHGADLERSNPERPWRVLNLNFAITAIRAGDEAMMRHAFAALETRLPDEAAGFFVEAQALAERAGLPAPIQALIRDRLAARQGGV